MSDKDWAVYNPEGKQLEELTVIYGFNKGATGSHYFVGQLISSEGEQLGSHLCSDEFYMECDLGIIQGTRPDRHETFRESYPNGYRMEFVSLKDVAGHDGIRKAYELRKERLRREE